MSWMQKLNIGVIVMTLVVATNLWASPARAASATCCTQQDCGSVSSGWSCVGADCGGTGELGTCVSQSCLPGINCTPAQFYTCSGDICIPVGGTGGSCGSECRSGNTCGGDGDASGCGPIDATHPNFGCKSNQVCCDKPCGVGGGSLKNCPAGTVWDKSAASDIVCNEVEASCKGEAQLLTNF